MSEQEKTAGIPAQNPSASSSDRLIKVDGMFENWFLDYASYVILERAVPDIHDGFKPVQHRIIHSMREMEDGRYNKVANIVGNTMKYHPHGDIHKGRSGTARTKGPAYRYTGKLG